MENKTQAMPISIDEITAVVMEALGSIVNPGANGEEPRLDLSKISPAPLFIGAYSALCEAHSQLHSTEEQKMDYITSSLMIQELFTRYLVDKNIENTILQIQNQANKVEQVEAEIVE